jgi:hypothetical protein
MNILRNVLAIVIGTLFGMFVNMGIITISSSVIPLPEGVNPKDLVSIKENIHLYTPIHFLMPFLAHALGTLVGAIVAGLIAASHKMYFALSIGGFFLLGGVSMVFMLPSPMWFNATDVILAYIPMGYLGYLIAVKIGGPEQTAKKDVLEM